jgi:hypothetical protein
MTRELTQLTPHIEEMRTKLADTADAERALVQSLSDALNRMDQDTMQGVRTMAAEHEARRAGILEELQALAASIGTFPGQQQNVLPNNPALESRPAAIPKPVAKPHPAAIPDQMDYGYQYSPPVGDWRQATKNVNLQDDLEALLNGLNGKSLKN